MAGRAGNPTILSVPLSEVIVTRDEIADPVVE